MGLDLQEIAALRKAALWSALAGAAQIAIPLFGDQAYPFLYDLLTAIGYGLIFPLVAVLQVRNAPHRHSGAILGTMTGTLPRLFGQITALLGALCFLVVPLETFGPGFTAVMPRSVADVLTQPWFAAAHVVLGLWLLAVATIVARARAGWI